MTGRELIVYILENGLENDDIFKDGGIVGFIPVEKAAVKWGVGNQTVYAFILSDVIDWIQIGDTLMVRDSDKPIFIG